LDCGSMGKAMRAWERDLKRIPGVVTLETTNGSHLKLRLTNGRFVIAASSSGDVRALRNTTHQVEKELRWVGGISANR
jgi:hypothetical protein